MKAYLMGVVFVLLTAACVIPYLAMREQYDMFADGTAVKAKVVKLDVRKDKAWARVEFPIDGKVERTWVGGLSAELGKTLSVGKELTILQHRRSPRRVRHPSTVENEKPSILFIFGAVFAFALAIYCFMYPRLRRRRRAMRTDPIEMVIDALSRTRWVFTGTSIGLFVFGGFLIFLVFFTSERPSSTGGMVAAILCIAGIFGIGAFTTRKALRIGNPRKSEIFDIIRNRPGRISWIYHTVVTVNGVSGMTVNVWLDDGKHHPLSVADDDADDLLADLARRAPDAMVGYTQENKDAYHDRFGGKLRKMLLS